MDLPPPPVTPTKAIVMTEQTAPRPKLQLQERVRLAFESVRDNDLTGVTQLQTEGAPLVLLLTNYLSDKDDAVRREAVSLLSCVAGPAALPLLITALNDSAAEIRERAARALYEKYDVPTLVAEPGLEKSLLQSVNTPEPPAASVLLLAYFPSAESTNALTKLRDLRPVQAIKLHDWSTPIPLDLVAKVALARHGSLEDQQSVIQAFASPAVSHAEFLLAALREIDSSTLLREFSKFLDDTREASTLMHSAPNLRPRLCDLAVNALVKRLELKVSFAIGAYRHYQAVERDEVRRLFEQAVPRSPVPEKPR